MEIALRGRWSEAIAHDGGILCELFEERVHTEFGLFHTGDLHLVTGKEVLQFCVAVLNTVVKFELQELPTPSKAGPAAIVLVWAGEGDPIERYCWERESPDERVERISSISEYSASLLDAAGGTELDIDQHLHGASRR